MRIIKWLVTIFLVYMLILGLVAITFCIASVPALFRSYRERAKIKAPVTSEASKAMIADIDVPVLNSLTVKSLKAHKASSEDTDIPDSIPRQAPKGALKVIKIASRGDTPPEEPPLKRLEGFEVTWYNNDGLSYNTATGTTTTDGITAAVDPSVIPLGSWFYIHMPDGTMLKRRAEDTGSAVKGNVIDIYADETREELLERGRTKGAQVIILD